MRNHCSPSIHEKFRNYLNPWKSWRCKDPRNVWTKAAIEEPNNPFYASKERRFVVSGTINGVKARIITDPGAELDYISSDFCSRNFIELKQENRIAVKANMIEKIVNPTLESSVISIVPYSESMHLVVAQLQYDLVLEQK